MTSTIPTEIGFMTSLRRIDFDVNMLSGTIPSETGLLTRLTRLDFDDNLLTSTIPSELGSLESLEELNLYRNSLNGTLPIELAQLSPSLVYLSLHGNDITGTVPTEYAAFSRLRNIRLNSTMLTGNVSLSFCNTSSSSAAESNPTYDTFYMDCLGGKRQPEIECFCCTLCCDDNECKVVE